jgi:hypothetical protein
MGEDINVYKTLVEKPEEIKHCPVNIATDCRVMMKYILQS